LDIALSSHIWDGHPQYYFRDGLKPPITCRQESLNSKQAVVNEARQIRSAQWRLQLADFMANAKLLRLGLGV
jgi:uncharacterized protein HemX